MAINTGVNQSKIVGFAPLAWSPGVYTSKIVAFAVLANINTNPPVWPSFTFPTGYLGLAYSQNWDLTPAAAPTTYTLVSGSLPTGLSLSNVSADIGQITGTPTVLGTFSFTLRATNTYGTADKTFSITITTSGGGSYAFVA